MLFNLAPRQGSPWAGELRGCQLPTEQRLLGRDLRWAPVGLAITSFRTGDLIETGHDWYLIQWNENYSNYDNLGISLFVSFLVKLFIKLKSYIKIISSHCQDMDFFCICDTFTEILPGLCGGVAISRVRWTWSWGMDRGWGTVRVSERATNSGHILQFCNELVCRCQRFCSTILERCRFYLWFIFFALSSGSCRQSNCKAGRKLSGAGSLVCFKLHS